MSLVKRSLTLKGHRTSLALEPEFWQVLDETARSRKASLASVVDAIDGERPPEQALSSAVRVWVIRTLRRAART
ncbi:ribbon-helix-helix domain-containing protein [Polymorphum gilvum]|uniref:Arylsulfate sulfotransferase-like protein n=1 Tax=Polymorphum gilvum (strain LMG 25793 / CGMCC 1.9160 / SL003B-26A1) TaxID=991905 RepID=F2J2A0_POLGS|nr:ribbon-helix-helix domain-containing protein [Polymorphum gilvum]ADZ69796.1 Arylsulfate sulfotransferase-like protein [Polymorphum gilvum SL003B-26A1]